jgi:thymidylate synthase
MKIDGYHQLSKRIPKVGQQVKFVTEDNLVTTRKGQFHKVNNSVMVFLSTPYNYTVNSKHAAKIWWEKIK